MSYQEPFVEVIDTNLTKKPSTAQIIIKNPLRADIFVNAIQLSFDPYFSSKGIIMIKINDNIILIPKPVGTYKRIQNFTVPLQNQEFLDQKKIEVFAWNGSDSDFVSVGVNIQISEDPEKSILPDTTLTQTIRNKLISDPETTFSQRIYSGETVTKLLDMKGHKKIILILGGAVLTAGRVVHSDTMGLGNSANAIDGSMSTKTGFNSPNSAHFAVDFGSLRTIKPSARYNLQSTSGTTKYHLETSVNGIDWTTRTTQTITTSGDHDITASEESIRYVRVRGEYVSGSNHSFAMVEVFDGNEFGGTAFISFEVKDAFEGWAEIISSSDIGAVSEGDPLAIQLGDVVTNVALRKINVVLPSTQTDLRVKMIVTGNLSTNVQIIKVS